MAAESSFLKNNLQGTIQLRDGTGTPVTLTLAYDRGDLRVSNIAAELNEPVPLERRGKFTSLNVGNRLYPQITFTCFVGNVVGSSASAPGTPLEFITGKGAYSANISTLGANRKMTFNLRLTIEGTNFGDAADEQLTASNCYGIAELSEAADGNVLSVTATCYGTVELVNNTNTVTFSQVA